MISPPKVFIDHMIETVTDPQRFLVEKMPPAPSAPSHSGRKIPSVFSFRLESMNLVADKNSRSESKWQVRFSEFLVAVDDSGNWKR